MYIYMYISVYATKHQSYKRWTTLVCGRSATVRASHIQQHQSKPSTYKYTKRPHIK